MIRIIKINLAVLFLLVQSHISNAQDVIRILPLGNSLTFGYMYAGKPDGDCIGYRYKLFNLLNTAGYNFDFVGNKSSGYNYFSDSQNGGMTGIKDDQLAYLMANGFYNNGSVIDVCWPDPYLTRYPADIILLEVGTNDCIAGETGSSQMTAAYTAFFNAVDTYESTFSTEVLVIISKVINKRNASHACQGTDTNTDTYNNVLTTIVNDRINAGDKIKLIDIKCGAGIDYTTDMYDDYHPNQTGYDKMGQKWFDEINNINTAPIISPITVAPSPKGTSFPPISLDSYITDDYTADATIVWSVSPAPTNYNVTINAQRVVTVTPKDANWIGSEVITFIATDNGHYIQKLRRSSSVLVTFNTIYVNAIPEILSQVTTFNLTEDTPFQIALSDLQIQDDDAPSNWTLHIKPGTNYTVAGSTITPAQDFNGQLNVNVTVSDLENESEVFTVVANYIPVNDAPAINGGGPLTTAEDVPLEINITDLDYYDPDNTLDQLILYVLSGTNYTVNGRIITPVANFNGQLQVGVRLRDLGAYSNIYTLTINCTPVNDAPVISSLPIASWSDNVDYEYQLIASDPDTDAITFTSATLPHWLQLDPGTGLLGGLPLRDDTGAHEITLFVSDGITSSNQIFTLEIIHSNNPPDFTSVPDTLADINSVYEWTADVYDFDGDNISFIPVKIPYFLTFLSESGKLTGTPSVLNEGIHLVKIGATDGTDTTLLEYSLYVDDYIGLHDFSDPNKIFTLFPNPASSSVTVSLSQAVEKSDLKIINLTGNVVADYHDLYFNNNAMTLDISSISAGAYLIVLSIDQEVFTQKLLIIQSVF
jgi:hypothetical protein